MKMERLAIIGSGDLAKQIIHYATDCKLFQVVGVFDDFSEEGFAVGTSKVIGKVDEVTALFKQGEFDKLLIAVGYSKMQYRMSMFNRFKDEIPLATLIHPSCSIDSTAIIGSGSVLFPGCIIDYNVEIGQNTLLNVGTIITHDSKIGNHSFFGPGVKVAGFVKVDEACFMGIGTTIIDNLHICAEVQSGGGAVITNSITEKGLYVGVPAKKIKA